MKIVFVSNFLSSHQIPFCDQLYKVLGDDFKFIATEHLPEERKQLGYVEYDQTYPYVFNATVSPQAKNTALCLTQECDILIQGSAPIQYALGRFRDNKIVFNYCERLFKKGIKILLDPRLVKAFYTRHTANRQKRVYVLCASAYTAYDMKRIFAYPDKMFRWGYFPQTFSYDPQELFRQKHHDVVELLWAGRMIDWKHPERALQLARYLKQKKYSFHLTMIGTGALEEPLKEMAKSYDLSGQVDFLGSMPTVKVRDYMVKSNIFLSTSNREEGWGAVVNEAMNSGCAVLVSDRVGAAPFLIQQHHNGLIFQDSRMDDFYQKAEQLVQDKTLVESLGIHAYETIRDIWNGMAAADRFLKVCENLLQSKPPFSFDIGPMSKAQIIKG